MANRPAEDIQYELGALDQAHNQNELARDTFVGLGHTALFAASSSLVGNLISASVLRFRYLIVGGWAVSVLGLVALTFSFVLARRAIDERRLAIHEPAAPRNPMAEGLNNFALLSFPVALICVFAFAAINVMSAMPKHDDKVVIGAVKVDSGRTATAGVIPPMRAPLITQTSKPQTGVIPAPRAPVTPPPQQPPQNPPKK